MIIMMIANKYLRDANTYLISFQKNIYIYIRAIIPNTIRGISIFPFVTQNDALGLESGSKIEGTDG